MRFITKLTELKEEAVQVIKEQMFINNIDGNIGVGYLVGILVIFIVAAALIPTAMTSFKGANTSAWTTSEIAVWTIIPLFAILGIMLGFAPKK